MRTFSCSSLNSVNVSSKTLLGFLYQTSHPPGRGRRLRKPPRRWGWLCSCPVSPSGRHRPTSCQRRTLRKQRAPWLVHGLCASSGWKRGIKESERSCADQHHFATDCQIKNINSPWGLTSASYPKFAPGSEDWPAASNPDTRENKSFTLTPFASHTHTHTDSFPSLICRHFST